MESPSSVSQGREGMKMSIGRYSYRVALVALTLLSVTYGTEARTYDQTKARGQSRTAKSSLTQADLDTVLSGKPMRLDQALAIAMGSSRALDQSIANLDTALGGVGESKSALLPQLSLGAQAAEYDKANVVDLGAMMGGPSLPLTIANRWNRSVYAGLNWQIDLSGAVRSAVSQAEFSALAARIDVDRVRNRLAFDVRSGFLQAVRAHAQIGNAEENLKTAETRLSDAQKYEAVGTAPKFDVVSAERDVAEARQALIVAESQETLSVAALKDVIGIDQATSVSLDDESNLATPESTAGATERDASESGSFAALVAEGLKYRPEVLESKAAIAAARHGLQYSRRSELPTLTAGLGYNYQPDNGAFTLQNSTVATLTLSVPIFDGGLAKARRKEANGALESAESNARAASDQVKLEIRSASIELLQARSRIAAAEAGLKMAREAYRIAKERYDVGVSQSSVVSPQLELSAAQSALAGASERRIDALIDYRIAEAALDHATGRFASHQNRPQ